MRPISPDDLLADGVDGTVMNGTFVRKGSVGAFIQNVKALQTLTPGSESYDAVAQQIRSLRPALEALEIFDVMDVRDPRVVEILAG